MYMNYVIMPCHENPGKLKESIAIAAQNRITSSDPISISAELADPMLPFLAGLLSSATQKTHVMLAGGTQMAAVLALADSLGYDAKKTAVATTSYVHDDESADFVSAVQQAGDVANPCEYARNPSIFEAPRPGSATRIATSPACCTAETKSADSSSCT